MSVNITIKETREGALYMEKLRELASKEVHIGFHAEDGFYEDDNGHMTETTVLDVAAWNEFGTVHIPERPFMRDAFDNHEEDIGEWAEEFFFGLETYEPEHILNELGTYVKGVVQEEIRYGAFEPNAPSTIKKKGSSQPLIDTGQMRQSVNFVVKNKGEREE